jgi:hypothetical protein
MTDGDVHKASSEQQYGSDIVKYVLGTIILLQYSLARAAKTTQNGLKFVYCS